MLDGDKGPGGGVCVHNSAVSTEASGSGSGGTVGRPEAGGVEAAAAGAGLSKAPGASGSGGTAGRPEAGGVGAGLSMAPGAAVAGDNGGDGGRGDAGIEAGEAAVSARLSAQPGTGGRSGAASPGEAGDVGAVGADPRVDSTQPAVSGATGGGRSSGGGGRSGKTGQGFIEAGDEAAVSARLSAEPGTPGGVGGGESLRLPVLGGNPAVQVNDEMQVAKEASDSESLPKTSGDELGCWAGGC